MGHIRAGDTLLQGAELLQAAELAGSDGEEDDDLDLQDANLPTSDAEASNSDSAIGDEGSDGSGSDEGERAGEEAPDQPQAGRDSNDGDGIGDQATTPSDARPLPIASNCEANGGADAVSAPAAGGDISRRAVPPLHLPGPDIAAGSDDQRNDEREVAPFEGSLDPEEGSLSGEGSEDDGGDTHTAASEEEDGEDGNEELPPVTPTTRPNKRPAPSQPGR